MNSIQFYRENLSKDLQTAKMYFSRNLSLEECLFAFYHIVMDSHVENRYDLLDLFLKKIEGFKLSEILENEEDKRSWALFTETTVKMLEEGYLNRKQYDHIWTKILKLELLSDAQLLMDELRLEYNSVMHIELFEELLEEHNTVKGFIDHWLEHDKIIETLDGFTNTKFDRPEITDGFFKFFTKYAEKYSDSKGKFNEGQTKRYSLCLDLLKVAKLNKHIEIELLAKLKSYYSIIE